LHCTSDHYVFYPKNRRQSAPVIFVLVAGPDLNLLPAGRQTG